MRGAPLYTVAGMSSPLPHSRAWMESHWDGMLDEVLREPRPRSAPISTTILLAELSVLRVHTGPLIGVLAGVDGIDLEDDIKSLVQRGLATPSQLWSLLEQFGGRFFLPMRQKYDPGWSADEFRDAMVQLAIKRDGVFSPQRFVVVATIVLGCMRRAFVNGGRSDAATALHALLDSVIAILANAVGTAGSQEDVAAMMRATGMDQYQRQFNAAAAAAYPPGESSSSAAAAAAAAAAYASSAPPAPPVSSMDDDGGGALPVGDLYPGEQLSQFDSLDSQQQEQQQPMPSSQSEWPLLLPPFELPPSPGASAEEHQAYNERMAQYASPQQSTREWMAGLGMPPSLAPSRAPSDITQEQQALMRQVAALQPMPPPPVYAAAAAAAASASAAPPGALGPDSNPPRIYSRQTATPEQIAAAEARRPPTRVSNDFKSVAELERDIRYYEDDLIPSHMNQVALYRARGDPANRAPDYEADIQKARADADRAREALQIARHASRAPPKARSNKKKTKKAEEEEEARRQAEVQARDAEWSANVERLQAQLTKAQAQSVANDAEWSANVERLQAQLAKAQQQSAGTDAEWSANVERLHAQLAKAQVDHDARVSELAAELEDAKRQSAREAHEAAMREASDRARRELLLDEHKTRTDQLADQIVQLQERVSTADADKHSALAAAAAQAEAELAMTKEAELATADRLRAELASAVALSDQLRVDADDERRRARAAADDRLRTAEASEQKLANQLQELERAHAAELAELRTKHETDTVAWRSQFAERAVELTKAIAETAAKHAAQLEALAAEHQAALTAKDVHYKREIDEMHTRRGKALDELEAAFVADFEKQAAATKAEHDKEIAKRETAHYEEMERTILDYEKVKRDLEAERDALRADQGDVNRTAARLAATANEQLAAERVAHANTRRMAEARVADMSARHRVEMDRVRRNALVAQQAPAVPAELADVAARATKFQRLRLAQLLDMASDADLDVAIAKHGGRADAALASLVDATEAEREKLLVEAWRVQRVSRAIRSIAKRKAMTYDLFDIVAVERLRVRIDDVRATSHKDMERVEELRMLRDHESVAVADADPIYARLAAVAARDPTVAVRQIKTRADLREVLQKLRDNAGDKAALDKLEQDDAASGLYAPLEAYVEEAKNAATGKSFAELVALTEAEKADKRAASNKKKEAAAAAAAAAAPPKPKPELTEEERAQRVLDAKARKAARAVERRAELRAAENKKAAEEAARVAAEEEKEEEVEYEYEFGASSSAAAAAAYHPPPLPPLAFRQHPYSNAAAAAAAASSSHPVGETDDEDEAPTWEQPRGVGMGVAQQEDGPAHKKLRTGRRFHLLGAKAGANNNCFNCDKAAPTLACTCARVHFCNPVCLERASGMHKCM